MKAAVTAFTEVEKIDASYSHIVALKKDGSLLFAGDNNQGQCNLEGITDALDISLGSFHTAVLKKDGTVYATGKNSYGECDLSEFVNLKVYDNSTEN